MLCMVFLVGNVSAVEWNDKLTYSNDDLKVSLDNWWGFGTTIGTAELKSHPSVNYVKAVDLGNKDESEKAKDMSVYFEKKTKEEQQ